MLTGPLPGLVLTWQIDGLSAFFALVILSISAVTGIYALGHGRHHASFPGSGGLYVLFVFAMLGVVVAGDAFTFLIAWETMSLVSFALVLTEHRREEVRRAAWVYLVMTHTATAFIVSAFLLLARGSGSLVFAEWTAHASASDAGIASVIFVLGLVGFGTKAGMIPLHIWLPQAHPVAPAHVSALMSGVMIKLGIYGLLRLSFDWLAPGPAWWGALILGLGAASAVLGVLYALMEHDLKRLLAYHSVENIGIILFGVGAAVMARALGLGAIVALALSAALFHVANHATFKALLFLGAAAREVGALELIPMATLALLCIALGLAAVPVVTAIGSLVPAAMLPHDGPALGLAAPAGGRLVLPGIALALPTFGALALLLPRLLGPVRARVAETWACGIALQPVHEYTAMAFAKPIRLMFRDIVRPVRDIGVVHRSGTRFVASVHYRSHIAPIFERYVYEALTDRLVAMARVVRTLQNGSLQTYLAYLFAALLVALVLAR